MFSLGRAEEARAALSDGLAWARRIGNQRVERIRLAQLAQLAYHGGRPDQAADLLDAAEARRSDEFSGAMLLVCRGRLALPDQPGRAIEHAERLLAYADTTKNDEIRLDAHALLARGHRARGERDPSRAACDAFLARWHAIRGMHSRAGALVETGLVLAADERHSELAAAAALLRTPSPWADAARALALQNHRDAAAILDSIPSIPLRDAARELIRAAAPAPASGGA